MRNLHIPTNLERSWKIYHLLITQQVNKVGAQPGAVLTSPAANAKRESGGLQGSPALTGNAWCWGWTAATNRFLQTAHYYTSYYLPYCKSPATWQRAETIQTIMWSNKDTKQTGLL